MEKQDIKQQDLTKVQPAKTEIGKLGDGEVFIKRTESGAIKAIKARVQLSETAKELAIIQGKASITAVGYYSLNRIAALSIVTPKTLTTPDGKSVVNPYPILDQYGSIDKVWCKKMAIGYSPAGVMTITTSTLYFDTRAYFIQDLVKKIKDDKNAGRICMKSTLTPEELKSGIYLEITADGTLGVWANTNNADVLKVIETYIQTKLFAERKAQSIAERNALKKHPALGITYVNAEGPDRAKKGYVEVIGWVSDLSQSDIQNLADQAEKGENISDGVVIENSFDEIQAEDFAAAKEEEEEDSEADEAQAAHQSTNENADIEKLDRETLFKKVNSLAKALGAEASGLMYKKFNGTPISQLSDVQLDQCCKYLKEAIDAKAKEARF